MKLSAHTIALAAARRFGLDLDTMLGPSRAGNLVYARHIGMYLARQETKLSYPLIAKAFGRLDHSTVIHGVRTIERALSQPTTAEDVRAVRELARDIQEGRINPARPKPSPPAASKPQTVWWER